MVQGFETREVVQGAGPSGSANRPARQLGQVNVGAPRGGSATEIGAAQRTLGEVAKMGGAALQGFLDKKVEKDKLEGKLDYARGKTEADLLKAGVSTPRVEGFRALQAKTAYDQWMAKTNHDIKNGMVSKDPAEFKANLMQQADTVFDGIDLDDEDGLALATSFIDTGFTKLVATHTEANAVFMKDELKTSVSNAMVSSSLAQDYESLDLLVNNPAALGLDLSPDEHRETLLSGVRQTLGGGDFTILDAMGGIEGLRRMNATEAEIASVKQQYKNAQTMEQSALETNTNLQYDNVLREFKTGNISSAQAALQVEAIENGFVANPTYARTLLYATQSDSEDPLYQNPDAMDEIAMAAVDLEFNPGINERTEQTVDYLARKYDLPEERVQEALTAISKGHESNLNQRRLTMKKTADKAKQKQQQELTATSLLNTNFRDSLNTDPEVVQLALGMKRKMIAEEVRQDRAYDTTGKKLTAMIDKHVQFLRDTPVLDKTVQGDFARIAQSSPVDSTGKINEDHESSLQYLQAMREGGISENVIKKYAGDSYDYLSTAAMLTTGSTDPKAALELAYDATLADSTNRPTPRTNGKEATEEWNDIREDFFDNIEGSMIGSWFGSESDGGWDEVLTYQVKEAARSSADMDQWARAQIKAISTAYPNMPQSAVLDRVKKDLSSWEYVMGTMVPPRNGQSISEMMGINDVSGDLKSNSAMLVFMRDNADLLFPEGTEGKGWWDSFKDLAFDKTLGALEKISIEGEDRINPFGDAAFMGFTERRQRLINDIKMMDVTPLSNGRLIISMYKTPDRKDLVGEPIVVNAKDVGGYYKAKMQEDLRKGAGNSDEVLDIIKFIKGK